MADRRTGPTVARSTVLSIEQEAVIVAFRRHTLLPLDDCLYALLCRRLPALTRSSLHRCLERHGISRLPEMGAEKGKGKTFKRHTINFSHIDMAGVRTAEGKLYLFVVIDRTSKFVFVKLVRQTCGPRAPSSRSDQERPTASTPYSPTSASDQRICPKKARAHSTL